MTPDGFVPKEVEIDVGTEVVFENSDTRKRWPATNIHPTHTVYPNSDVLKCGTDEEPELFDACRGLESGETFSFTFNEPGRWRYHDHLHPQLTGSITVVGERAAAPPSMWERITDFFASIGNFFVRSYYRYVPGAAERLLADTKIFEIAEDVPQLRRIVEVAGPRVVMDKLLEESAGASLVDCHQEAHQVGRVSYELFGAEVFEEGDASCHSGFYHGAMEALLATEGTQDLERTITEICNLFGTRFGQFECIHGVGHGLMAFENYDMPAALDACDRLESDFAAHSCYGGVFMENVVAGQGLGAIPGHETQWVNTDPHFPCNADFVSQDRGRTFECYQMQTSWMLTLTNYDRAAVINECQRAPADMQNVCFRSLGRDIAGFTLRDTDRMIQECGQVPRTSGYYRSCITGALNVVVDFWGPDLGNQAHAFCEAVPDEAEKQYCHRVLENRLQDLFGNGE